MPCAAWRTSIANSRARKRRSSTSPAASSPPPNGRFIDLGSIVADWIEGKRPGQLGRGLVHGEGDFYGEPFVLDPFQRWLLRRLYLVDARTGRRIVRRALLVGPKGWGKTELMAAVGLAEECGPTAWDLDRGGPTMRRSPNIPIAAASYEQTDRLFGAAQVMATHERSGVAPFLEAYEHEIRVKGRPGRLFRVAAVAGTNEGGLPTAFLADELHEWQLPRQRRVHLVIGNSLAKRDQGLELNITTPDDANPDSLLGGLVAYGEKVASGEIADPSFFYVRYAATGEHDLDKPKELRAAIRQANPASWLAVEPIAARYEVDRIPEHELRRYHLGQFIRPAGTWLPAGTWAPLAAKRRPKGTPIVLGFDGSYNRDSTALVGCTLDGHLFVLGCWERPERARESWRVPRRAVDAAVATAFAAFRVVEMACDPHRWTSEIEEWMERYGEVVVDFPTHSIARMAPACARFYAACVSGEGISHDGNPALARHLHNAVVKEHRDGAYITKETRESRRHIDLAVAAVIAYDRAMWHATQAPVEVVLEGSLMA